VRTAILVRWTATALSLAALTAILAYYLDRLFLPQPISSFAALLMIGTQLYLVVSGNYAWLNWLTVVLGRLSEAPRPIRRQTMAAMEPTAASAAASRSMRFMNERTQA